MSKAPAKISFSCLMQLKNNLNRLTQEHLNYKMFLHIHKDLIDQVDLASVYKKFITVNDRRIQFFSKEIFKYLHLTQLSYWKQIALHILL